MLILSGSNLGMKYQACSAQMFTFVKINYREGLFVEWLSTNLVSQRRVSKCQCHTIKWLTLQLFQL